LAQKTSRCSLGRGRDGWREHCRDSRGLVVPGNASSLLPPRAGLNVQLTLDMGLQAIVEEELDACLAEGPQLVTRRGADDLTREGPAGPLAGTATTLPAPPAGVAVRRHTRTEARHQVIATEAVANPQVAATAATPVHIGIAFEFTLKWHGKK
jgi:cell division protein FtsI/penicillin-binding protein 2